MNFLAYTTYCSGRTGLSNSIMSTELGAILAGIDASKIHVAHVAADYVVERFDLLRLIAAPVEIYRQEQPRLSVIAAYVANHGDCTQNREPAEARGHHLVGPIRFRP